MNVAAPALPNDASMPRMLGAMHNLRHVSGRHAVAVAFSLLLISAVASSGCRPVVVTAAGVQSAVTPSLVGHGVTMTTFTQVAPTGFEGTGTDAKGDACRITITVSGGMLNYQVKSDVRTSEGGTVSASSSVVFGSMPYKE